MLGAESSVEVLRPVDPWAPAAGLPFSGSRTEPSSTGLRPDVVAAQMRLTAAEQARKLARAQRVRDVSVGVQVDRWPVSATNASGTGNTVSVFFSVPLFVRHGLEGEIARAEVDLANARETVRRAQLAALSDLAQTRSRWAAAAVRRWLASDELAPAAERVAAGAELAYRRGATSLLDVFDARRSLRAALRCWFSADGPLACDRCEDSKAAGRRCDRGLGFRNCFEAAGAPDPIHLVRTPRRSNA